jgi:eukaryotic-like serine/threonine-protein kinase
VQPPPDPLIGTIVDGRFRVEALLGRGGMGAVYRARHLLMDQPVALKVLAAERGGDPDAARCFVREGKSTFLLDHPHCVRLTDLGATSDGLLYLVMEYLDGRTLGAELAVDGPLAPARALHVAEQIARALEHAHGRGFVHRDLKPDNVMLLTRDGDPDFAKVLDFGLARAFDADVARAAAVSITPLTQEGIVFGTPDYMAPEQALGGVVGPAADLYGLGAVLYHAVTGAPPFAAPSDMGILTAHVREAVVPPSRRRPELALPAALDRVVLALLGKTPAERPAGAGAAAALLAAARREVASADRGRSQAAETLEIGASQLAVATAGPVAGGAAGTRRPRPITSPLRRRRVGVALFAVVLVGAAVGASVVAMSERRPPAAAPSAAAAAIDAGARSAAAVDAGARSAAAVDAAAAPEVAADAGPAGTTTGKPPDAAALRRAAANRHLRAAESARRAKNHLRQLAEADEALRLEPSSRRARELVGEALVAAGDRARGCAYLESFPRTRKAAGCAD